MADEKEKPQGPVQATANTSLSTQIQVTAERTQTFLVAMGMGSLLPLIAGALLTLKTMVIGVMLIIIAAATMIACFVGWFKSRRLAELKQPASLVLKAKDCELSLTGDGPLVHTDENQTLIMTLLSRLALQQPLPPPAGLVEGQATDPSAVVPINSDEAEQVASTLRQKMATTRDEVARALLKAGNSEVIEAVPIIALPPPEKK